MGIGPILPGRIPTALFTSQLEQNLAVANRQLANLQNQIATGQRFFLPSESPAEAARTIFLQSTIERKAQMQTNVRTDQSLLSVSESALATVGTSLNEAKAILLSGVGNILSSTEKIALADEIASILRGVQNAGNTEFRGRYLFGGSESQLLPFDFANDGTVRYNGDGQSINSFIDFDLLVANNVDGASAFGALTPPVGSDLDPALTLDTKIADLHGGAGVDLGSIVVTVDDTVNPVQSVTVDLSNAETIQDIKTILENAFAGPAPNLTVDVDPTSKNGIRLTPSGGTVAVADIAGSTVAADLGIKSTAAAVVNGADLDPTVTLLTKLADLNNGSGVAQTAGKGLLFTNGQTNVAVDISSAVTVEDLFNAIKSENLDLNLAINQAGNGLAISSRLSGSNFSIGENGDTSAADLGIRTFDASTRLEDLNLGGGVPVNELDESGNLLPALLEITRRDGTTTNVDLKGLSTVQEVIDAITAVDGNLTASLKSVGNGISIVDTSGAGPLKVPASLVSTALGLDGEETGVDNTVPLVGTEVHSREAGGVFNILVRLEQALRNEDDAELARLDPLLDKEIERFNSVRAEVGSRLKLLDEIENRLLDEEVALQEALSAEFDTDLATAITQFASVTSALEATLRIAATTLQLSLLDFL
jgi:flagellar hook-associated protein 3 FlgL